jgi:hypothetical protein
MERIRVPEPTVEECGGKILRMDGYVDEVRSWTGGLSSDRAYALTRDQKHTTRVGRRKLARRRKWKLEHRKILAERRATAILQRWDRDGDHLISRDELRHMLQELLPSATPTDDDLEALLRTCAGSPAAQKLTGQSGGSIRRGGSAQALRAEEALLALKKFALAVEEVKTCVGGTSVAESIASLAELDVFDELVHEEKADKARPDAIAEDAAAGPCAPPTLAALQGESSGAAVAVAGAKLSARTRRPSKGSSGSSACSIL